MHGCHRSFMWREVSTKEGLTQSWKSLNWSSLCDNRDNCSRRVFSSWIHVGLRGISEAQKVSPIFDFNFDILSYQARFRVPPEHACSMLGLFLFLLFERILSSMRMRNFSAIKRFQMNKLWRPLLEASSASGYLPETTGCGVKQSFPSTKHARRFE